MLSISSSSCWERKFLEELTGGENKFSYTVFCIHYVCIEPNSLCVNFFKVTLKLKKTMHIDIDSVHSIACKQIENQWHNLSFICSFLEQIIYQWCFERYDEKNKEYSLCSTSLWTACEDTKRNCKHHKTSGMYLDFVLWLLYWFYCKQYLNVCSLCINAFVVEHRDVC